MATPVDGAGTGTFFVCAVPLASLTGAGQMKHFLGYYVCVQMFQFEHVQTVS